jgi:predicted ferric reductase
MSEINLRIANFLKVFSMFMVVVSLAYMYAYVTERVDFLESDPAWYQGITKVYIFYVGLGIFTVFNLVMHLALSMYKNTEGVDKHSVLFKNELQKQKLLVWFTYLLTAGNVFIACTIFYLALVKINMVGNATDYFYLPLAGAVVLGAVLFVLTFQLLRK